MTELRQCLQKVFCIEFLAAVLSNPRNDEEASKVKIRPILKADRLYFQFETFKGKQVFHENLEADQALEKAIWWMEKFR